MIIIQSITESIHWIKFVFQKNVFILNIHRMLSSSDFFEESNQDAQLTNLLLTKER